MSDKKISQLDAGGAMLSDDLFVLTRTNENRKTSIGNLYIVDILYNNLADLKNGTNSNGNNSELRRLVKGQWYYITDKFIYIRALSENELQKDVFFRKRSASNGSIRLQSGTQGSIESIRVNGVDILGTPVAFNTDIKTTINDVEAVINTLTSSSNYQAVARDGTLDIYSLAANGINTNGYAVSGIVSAASGDDLLLDNAVAMNRGKEDILPIKYDFNADQISGIEHIGFTNTELFSDQVGVQTAIPGPKQIIFNKELEIGQHMHYEGLLQGFREDYKEGYSSKILINCWRGENEFYVEKCITRVDKQEIGMYYGYAYSASAFNGRPLNGSYNVGDGNSASFVGNANILSVDTYFNGWTVHISLGYANTIQISVESAPWREFPFEEEPAVDENYRHNWLLTHNYKILKNNF